ncbi:hypothetical protein DFP72DRAFT_508168 [Ephemerocybe angulata]|uniref:Chitin synthase export chaperone n=1 Tax=Ephemerocybe angulata TaxID=980116 RepID=A0A8H6HQQ7_9AGAR|nr:hypothetical protein DFP72DRAFT_508168 [Tulosesus angulatus]
MHLRPSSHRCTSPSPVALASQSQSSSLARPPIRSHRHPDPHLLRTSHKPCRCSARRYPDSPVDPKTRTTLTLVHFFVLPFGIFKILFLGVTIYVSLDIGLGVTQLIGGVESPPEALRNISLFVLTSAAAAFLYLVIMSYIVLCILNERRPMVYYFLAALLFVLSPLAFFLLGRVLCTASNEKLDSSFLATALETAAIGVLYLAWKSITEGVSLPLPLHVLLDCGRRTIEIARMLDTFDSRSLTLYTVHTYLLTYSAQFTSACVHALID